MKRAFYCSRGVILFPVLQRSRGLLYVTSDVFQRSYARQSRDSDVTRTMVYADGIALFASLVNLVLYDTFHHSDQ